MCGCRVGKESQNFHYIRGRKPHLTMKRPIFVVPLACLLAVGCARPAYVVRSDAERANLRGGVAQLRETYFETPADPITLPDTLGLLDTHTVIAYNRAGNITQEDVFQGADSIHTKWDSHTYDPSGTRLQRSESRTPTGKTSGTLRYTYDAAGRLARHEDERWGWHADYGYDRHGYLKRRVEHLADSTRRIVRYRYYPDGALRRTSGNERARYRYHPGGAVAEIRSERTETYIYDERGHLRSATSRVKERNDRGRVVRRFPATIVAEYEFDERGNWIRRRQTYKGQTIGVAIREIIYY